MFQQEFGSLGKCLLARSVVRGLRPGGEDMLPHQEFRSPIDPCTQEKSRRAVQWEGRFKDFPRALRDHPEILDDPLPGTGR